MTYEIIKQNYKNGLWTAQMVKVAVIKRVITEEQYKDITGLDYNS